MYIVYYVGINVYVFINEFAVITAGTLAFASISDC